MKSLIKISINFIISKRNAHLNYVVDIIYQNFALKVLDLLLIKKI